MCKGWRTKLDLGGRKPLDNSHGSTTDRTSPESESIASLGMGWVLGCDFGTEFSNCEHSGSNAVRWQLARKPKLRMRTKPRGSTWRRNRRKNSSTGIVIKRFLFW